VNGGEVIKPSPRCQEEIWRLIGGFETALNYIDSPWFPTAVSFTVARDSVVIKDESGQSSIELRKGIITVNTRPCIMSVSKHEVVLYQCVIFSYERGRWIWFDRSVVPFLSKEYFEAEELYERLRHLFKVLAGHFTDKLGF